jgi:CheY-like chemotaxis protein
MNTTNKIMAESNNMESEVTILLAEDDEGHAQLIKKNLKRAGISNDILHFVDGQEIINFLFKKGDGPYRKTDTGYLLLLDIRMPKVNGVQVLRQIKEDAELRKLPVTMLTTTDDPREVENCHILGCSNYITKPVDYDKFVVILRQLGLFLSVVKIPILKDLSSEKNA